MKVPPGVEDPDPYVWLLVGIVVVGVINELVLWGII